MKEGVILMLLAEMLGWANDLQDLEKSLLKEANGLTKRLTWERALKDMDYRKRAAMNAV